ncbi:MAG: hypothetical protein H8E86_08560 [Planctomycetes bacterium]|nr:hypothetical protein [Planctomycetota bacterium]
MILALSTSAIIGMQCIATIPIDTIESKQKTPLAPRNGVLMVQLVSENLGDGWPSTIDVTFENGTSATGYLGWIGRNKKTSTWTSSPATIRPITSIDNTSHIHPLDAITGPVLLVELPSNMNGAIRFGGAIVDPTWVALPNALPNLNIFPASTELLQQVESDALPQWNALEYWRWTLIASRQGLQPPPPPSHSNVARLSALHGAQMWRIGFDALARSSRGVAAACRDLLTNIALDDGHPFACWIVQPDVLSKLLSTLTDQNATSRQITARALRWAEEQQPFLQWLEGVYGKRVSIAMTNPTLEPSLATIVWRENDDFPIALELLATATTRAKIDRVAPLDLSAFGPETFESSLQWLHVQMGTQRYALPIVPSEVVVLPPSILLPKLHPLWNLNSMRSGIPAQINNANATTVEVRKLLGNWELFIQCSGNSENNTFPNDAKELSHLIGIEAITIIHGETNAFVSIASSGAILGGHVPSDFKVTQSSDSKGWKSRIELPSEWIVNEHFSFSIVRTHGDSLQVETAPLPCVPWNVHQKPIVLDFSAWDQVQSIPTTSRN